MIGKEQAAYFKDSFNLKKRLDILAILGSYSLITFDMMSMYTDINTLDCIERLSVYLRGPLTKTKFPPYTPKALVAAIKLVIGISRPCPWDPSFLTALFTGLYSSPCISGL